MKRCITALAALVLIALVGARAFAVDPANLNRVTVANETGYNVNDLFFSPSDSNLWGADILGSSRTLNNGEEATFFIHYPNRSNSFDILAIDEDGDAYLIPDFVITDGTPALLEITFDEYQGSYDMDQLARVDLTNDSGYDMWYIFFSPGDSEMWGVDMLGGTEILGDGETLSLFVQVDDAADRYDVLGVDEDEDLYGFSVEVSNEQTAIEYLIELTDVM